MTEEEKRENARVYMREYSKKRKLTDPVYAQKIKDRSRKCKIEGSDKRYQAKNKEKIKEKKAIYYQENRERFLEYQKVRKQRIRAEKGAKRRKPITPPKSISFTPIILDTDRYGVIYIVENVQSRKVYVGQTVMCPERYYKINFFSAKGGGRIKIANAIKKYGIEGFSFTVIDQAYSKNELNEKESRWITDLNSIEAGYNIKTGGSNGRLPPESIEAMRQKKIGRPTWNKGVPMDEGHKKMLIKLSTGREPWNKGIPQTEECKLKVSQSRKGKSTGLSHPLAKVQTIRNIETGETVTGCLAEMARQLNFSRSNMSQQGKTKGWELVNNVDGKKI